MGCLFGGRCCKRQRPFFMLIIKSYRLLYHQLIRNNDRKFRRFPDHRFSRDYTIFLHTAPTELYHQLLIFFLLTCRYYEAISRNYLASLEMIYLQKLEIKCKQSSIGAIYFPSFKHLWCSEQLISGKTEKFRLVGNQPIIKHN